MMKKTAITLCRLCLAVFLMFCCAQGALAQGYDAQTASAWLETFAGVIAQLEPLHDPAQTADPARAGQVLLEYDFGTVLVQGSDAAGDILQIDLRTPQIVDCRGVCVGMRMEDALDGERPGDSSTQLYVLGTQESGYGWRWAYVDGAQVYGVEYITYDGEDAAMTEYTLTYVIDGGVISAIRMRMSPATLAQAQEGLRTAEEIAGRQAGEVLALPSSAAAFCAADLQMMGGDVLGQPVADFVARIGEPQDVQALAEGRGRILVYDGAVVQLNLDKYTGVEVVRGVSVSSPAFFGPRRLTVGLSVQEAAALFRCDQEVSSLGGVLYLEGEAQGEPPYGELQAEAVGEAVLRYVCEAQDGRIAVLEAGISDGAVTYWRLYDQQEAGDGV